MKLHTLFKTREPENHTLLGGIKYPVADTDVFPVVASPHWKILSGGEKRRSEIRLCPQATTPRRETHTTAEPLYNEFLGITNDYLYPSNSKVYAKEPRYIKTSLYSEHIFILPATLPLRHIEDTLQTHNSSVNSKRAYPPPPPGICRAFFILSIPAVGNLSENLCLEVAHLSILLEEVNIVPFSIFHLKI